MDQYWPCSEETRSYWIDRTTDIALTYKSPFSDKSVKNLNLLSKEEAKIFPDRTCLTQRSAESISDEEFTAKGIRNPEYMVVFYTNEVKGATGTLPCCVDQGSCYIKCSPWGGFRWTSYSNCMDGTHSYYPSLDFEVKAFSHKTKTEEDINEINPFEILENINLSTIMLNLKNYAASLSAIPAERKCTNVTFDLNFIK